MGTLRVKTVVDKGEHFNPVPDSMYCYRPSSLFLLFAGSGRTFISFQGRVTAITLAFGTCTFVVSLLFQINHNLY
jgi:hypothetical protein